MIHPTAIIAPGAQVHATASVGPYSIIEAGAVVGEGCRIDSCVRIFAPTRLGAFNRVCHGVTLGSDAHRPQDVGRDFDAAYRLLEEVDVGETAVFERRRRSLRPVPAVRRPSAG